MKTENLIENLTNQSKASDRSKLPPPAIRFFFWLALSGFSLSVFLLFFNFCPRLIDNFQNPLFLIQFLSLSIAALSSALCAFYLNVPGLPKNKIWLWIPWIGIVLWMITLVTEWIVGPGAFRSSNQQVVCAASSLGIGLIPGIVLFLMISRGAPTELKRSGLYAALSAISFGSMGALLVHSDYSPKTLLLSQLIPLIILCFIGIYLGKKILRW